MQRGRKATGVGKREDLENKMWPNEPKLQKSGLLIIYKISVNYMGKNQNLGLQLVLEEFMGYWNRDENWN